MDTDLTTEDETTEDTDERVLTDWEIKAWESNIQRLELTLEFLRDRPLIGATTYIGNIHAYANNKADFQEMLAELGTYEKDQDSHNVVGKKDMIDGKAREQVGYSKHMAFVSFAHEEFCEKVQDGVTIETEYVLPEGVETVKVEKSVPKYKWVCPQSWKEA